MVRCGFDTPLISVLIYFLGPRNCQLQTNQPTNQQPIEQMANKRLSPYEAFMEELSTADTDRKPAIKPKLVKKSIDSFVERRK